jgi:hypothetical protein
MELFKIDDGSALNAISIPKNPRITLFKFNEIAAQPRAVYVFQKADPSFIYENM